MPISDRTRELIQSALEGIASPADIAELDKLLIADAEVASAFAEAARLHALLDRHFRREYKIAEVATLLGEPEETAGAIRAAEPRGRPNTTFVARCAVPVESRPSIFVRSRAGFAGSWRWIAALLLIAAVGSIFWLSAPSEPDGYRVVSGHVAVGSRDASLLPEDAGFEVSGRDKAVIELPGGGRIELGPATRAALHRDGSRVVLKLVHGGGNFVVSGPQPALRVETPLGVVTATEGRFSIDLVTATEALFSPTERPRPQLTVAVAQGSVTIERLGVTTTLAAGERREFFGTI